MKKTALIIMLILAAMILGVTAVQAAENKGQYYEEIDANLCLIEIDLKAAEVDPLVIQADLSILRGIVYNCARFLTLTGEYDARILNVISLATKATEMTTVEDQFWYLSRARILASEILLGRIPEDPGCPDGLCDGDHS